jgi:hypothetical protein
MVQMTRSIMRRLVEHPFDLLLLMAATGAILVGALLVAGVFADERTLGIVFLVGGALTIYNAVRVAGKSHRGV